MKRARIGDVVEIRTGKGLAYAQYCHKKEQWGALLRILPGTFPLRPQDLAALVRQKESFVTFFPLQAALSKGIVGIVGHEPVRRRPNRSPSSGPPDSSIGRAEFTIGGYGTANVHGESANSATRSGRCPFAPYGTTRH